MKKFFYLIIFLTPALLISSCKSDVKQDISNSQKPEVKNIIFLIGDGMGTTQVYSAMTKSKTPLNFERFPVSGFSKTFSLDNYITDSAGAGTALATGHKTANGVIGQDTLGNAFTSILEVAEEKGLASGLVATSSITHATPASFIAHQASRKMLEAIAKDFLNTEIDVFIGGGYDNFAKRKDGLNLIDSLISRGYTVTQTIEEVMSAEASLLAGFTAPDHNPSMPEGRGHMLPEATKKALEILDKNEKGFFLMVEGSQIDWGGHANDLDYVVTETLDFDQAVGVALDFAEKDGQTLVIVTADHETGGLSIIGGDMSTGEMEASFGTGHHSSVMVPVFAYGPGAQNFSGIIDNVDFFYKFIELYGFSK